MDPLINRFLDRPPQHLITTGSPAPMAVAYYRRVFTLDELPRSAAIALYADARFHLWVNGRYIARGPTFHHPHRLPVTAFDVAAHLRPGSNVTAVLVRSSDTAFHNHVPTAKPGLSARLAAAFADGRTLDIDTDDQWRTTADTGWRSDAPRRSWAIDHVEIFDAAAAPAGWWNIDFDDSRWHTPTVAATALPDEDDQARFIASDLPPLAERFMPVVQRIGFHETAAPPIHVTADFAHRDYAERLLAADRAAPSHIVLHGELDQRGGGWRIDNLTSDHGAILEFDLGIESVGRIALTCDCESAGVIDVAWSEFIRDGRPVPLQKGTSYADQLHASPGRLVWQPIQFTGARYLILYLRGFTGSVTVHELGLLATEPALDYRAHFRCSDDRLNDIFTLCEHTVRAGTQESLMDCPTREQASYIGDGHPVARWLAMLTGDARHWKHLVREQAQRPDVHGLIRSTPFSGCPQTLLDYNLLAVIWARDYIRYMHDRAIATESLQALRKIIDHFDQRTDTRGLFNWHWTGAPGGGGAWEHCYKGRSLELTNLNLFIDHPGMGWHNIGEPGINRRGFNAAINALRVAAMGALADLESATGRDERAAEHRAAADQLARTVLRTFYRPERGLFDDGELDGQPLNNFSQQTNAWVLAALSDVIPADQQKQIAERMIDPADGKIARCGPYFWLYLYPVLARHGLHEQALEQTRELWGRMLDGGATTLWETFAGDDLDSACHPWSAPPLEFLLCDIAGLPSEHRAELRPRPDLLPQASARIVLPNGEYEIAWTTAADGSVEMHGRCPSACAYVMPASHGGVSGQVSGQWELHLLG